MSHPTYPPVSEPLVARNPFRGRAYKLRDIPGFVRARELLPAPVLPDHPGWVEMYWRAWELAWHNLRRPTPESGLVSNYIDAAFNAHIFMWDSAFMTLFGLYGRRAFNFMGSLDNFYAKQHEDGFICREIHGAEGYDFFQPFDPRSTGPNILAWAEWTYFRRTGDDSRLGEVFWPLLAFQHWLRKHRTWPSGLYWTTGLGSGMDNQTRVPDGMHYHHHWTWVDASLQASLNYSVLAQMAQHLGEDELALELTESRTFLQREINVHLWNAQNSFYQDIDPQGNFSPVKSIGAYWALLDKDMVPPDRLEPFLRHLRATEAFNRPHRIPAQSADSAGYAPETGDYWRGGVWTPTNFMVLRGLRLAGQPRLAHQIALNHLENVYEVFRRTDTLWENYAPEGAAPGEPSKPDFVGWTGLSPIAVLLEDAIGIQVDWPLRRVTWDRRLQSSGPWGVRNFPLGPEGTLDLIAHPEAIEVVSDVPFNLTLVDEEGGLQTAVLAGRTEIEF